MALGFTCNLTMSEVILLLNQYADYKLLREDAPFASHIANRTILRLDELMDHLARWTVVVKQGEYSAATTHKTWQQLAFPPPEAGVE